MASITYSLPLSNFEFADTAEHSSNTGRTNKCFNKKPSQKVSSSCSVHRNERLQRSRKFVLTACNRASHLHRACYLFQHVRDQFQRTMQGKTTCSFAVFSKLQCELLVWLCPAIRLPARSAPPTTLAVLLSSFTMICGHSPQEVFHWSNLQCSQTKVKNDGTSFCCFTNHIPEEISAVSHDILGETFLASTSSHCGKSSSSNPSSPAHVRCAF